MSQFLVMKVLQQPAAERPCPKVMKALCKATGRVVVVKLVREDDFVENEVTVPRLVSPAMDPHPHVMAVLQTHREPGRGVYMVTDFAAGGDLYEAVARRCICRTELETVQVALQVVAGLRALHERHILYGDLKLENVVLTSGTVRDGVPVVPVVRLIDFGLARRVGPTGMVLAHVIGTNGYIAPEVVCGERVTTQADVWSFGMLVYNMTVCGMMCDRAASKSKTLALQLAAAAKAHTYIQLSPGLARLVKDCLEVDPTARPTAAKLARRLAAYSRALQIELQDKMADDAFRMGLGLVPDCAP